MRLVNDDTRLVPEAKPFVWTAERDVVRVTLTNRSGATRTVSPTQIWLLDAENHAYLASATAKVGHPLLGQSIGPGQSATGTLVYPTPGRQTGNLLVYASQVRQGEPFDVNLKAEAPAASIFKIVTAAALLETPSLNAHTEQCYSGGGQHRIQAKDLQENPGRDRSCVTLASAGETSPMVLVRIGGSCLRIALSVSTTLSA